jgi:hypothetical protein
MTAKKSKAVKTVSVTYPVAVTRDDAHREFKRSLNYIDNPSTDDPTAAFLRTMDAVYELYPEGWTVTEILRLSEKWAIDSRKVLELWSSYRVKMLALSKIVEVATCLDEKMFTAVR